MYYLQWLQNFSNNSFLIKHKLAFHITDVENLLYYIDRDINKNYKLLIFKKKLKKT